MIRINQIKMPLHHNAAALEQKIRKRLGLSGGQELRYRIIRKSIDARKKPELSLVYSVEVSTSGEEKIIKRANDPNVTIVKQTGYYLPGAVSPTPSIPPVIVGAGPAGLFCAYALTMSGCAPVVLERGRSVTERTKDVERFWESGVLDTVSNVQFGEGGAGTFSDGKLNTLVKDPTGRNRFVLETFVKFGAPEQILYENKPHIGTDILAGVIKNMRQAMEARGARFCFESCMTDYRREADGKMFVESQPQGVDRDFQTRSCNRSQCAGHVWDAVSEAGSCHGGKSVCGWFPCGTPAGDDESAAIWSAACTRTSGSPLQSDSEPRKRQRRVFLLHVSGRICGKRILRGRAGLRSTE